MIKSNIRLVISIAKNYQGAGMNLQDLVQVCDLFHAIELIELSWDGTVKKKKRKEIAKEWL